MKIIRQTRNVVFRVIKNLKEFERLCTSYFSYSRECRCLLWFKRIVVSKENIAFLCLIEETLDLNKRPK